MTALPHESSGWRRLRELWRAHKLSFLVTASLVLAAGLYVTFAKVPNVYRAEAFVVIQPAGARLVRLPASALKSEIAGRAVLSAVAEQMGILSSDAPPTTRQTVVADLREKLHLRVQTAVGGETEIALSSRGHDRKKVAQLVNLAAKNWVEQCRERSRIKTEKIARIREEATALQTETNQAKAALQGARTELEAFEKKYTDVLSEVSGDPDAALKGFREDQRANAEALEKVQTEVAGLEAAEKLLREQLEKAPRFIETKEVTTVRDPERVALEREIRMMERQLEEMLRTYTFRHPEIIAHQTNIVVKKRQLRQLKERVQDSVKSSKEQNPEYTLLKGRLDETMVKLQIARSTLQRHQRKSQHLVDLIDGLRGLANSHGKLKDGLDAARKRHEEEQARLAARTKALDESSDTMEPPPEINTLAEVPRVPVGPRRSLYITVAVILALLAGRVAMSAAFHMSTGFASEFELSHITGMPVAGTIGAIPGTRAASRQQLHRRIMLVLWLVVLATLAALAAWLYSHHPGISTSGG